jgi:aromatic-L-amino-acid decarboxylase
MEIDRCTRADYDAIMADLAAFWGSDRTRALHHPTWVHEFGDTAYAARVDGRLVGYLFGFRAQTGPVAYVHLVGVRAEARRLGAARSLYARFARDARERGCTEVKAITSPGNAASIAFHRALGMQPVGDAGADGVPVVRDYGGPGEDRVVFRGRIVDVLARCGDERTSGAAAPDDSTASRRGVEASTSAGLAELAETAGSVGADRTAAEATEGYPLRAWSGDEIRRVGGRVVDLIAEHLTTLPEKPVFQPVPPAVVDGLLSAPLPRNGEPVDALLEDFARRIAPYPLGNGHPRFHAWVNSPPTPVGIFADALAAAMNPSVAGGNQAAVYVERQVVAWFREILEFPASAMGLLVSGGSAAALTGLAVARHVKAGFDVRARGLHAAPRPLAVYVSPETHGCYQKAVELLGIGSENLRKVETDGTRRMRPEALDAAIAQDRARGWQPMAVVASAGTVNTGAIDPLGEIADVCAAHGVWMHVDGAYGAPAVLTGEYRQALAGLGRADSVAMDPHKWLSVPVEAGLVLVRDGEAMRAAFSLVPPYLRLDGNPSGVNGPPWLSEYGIQQTRGFRALKVWMALRHHGTEGYRRAVEHDIAMARRLAGRIRATPGLELVEPQSLSVVCFRAVPPHLEGDEEGLNDFNRRLTEGIQLRGRSFIANTVLDGRLVLRACIVSFRTTEADVDALVDEVGETAAGLE